MTVQDVTNTIDYIGNDVQTSFVFVFRADDTTWIDLNFTTDLLSITLNADQDSAPGGTVEYSVAPPNLQLIRITRITPQDQDLDYTRYDAFDSESHEDALDKLTMQVQDLQETIDGFTSDAILANGTLDDTILRWNDTGQTWDEFFAYIFPLLDGNIGQAIVTDGAGNLSFSSVSGSVNDGTVDGQINIWDVGLDQWVPVADGVLRINPLGPPSNPNGRIISGGSSTTDVRKATLVVNVGASVTAVWSTNKGGGTQEGFYSRSQLNGSTVFHDWGFWDDANQTGITNFTIFDDGRFLLDFVLSMRERAASFSDIAGRGQYWVRNDAPNTPVFTDDTGVDHVLNAPAGGGQNGCKAFRTSNSPTLTTDVPTVIEFTAEAYDTNSFHNTISNRSRLTIPAGVSIVRLNGSMNCSEYTTGGKKAYFTKNGTAAPNAIDSESFFLVSQQTGVAGGVGETIAVQTISGQISVSPGDFFEYVAESLNQTGIFIRPGAWFEIEVVE